MNGPISVIQSFSAADVCVTNTSNAIAGGLFGKYDSAKLVLSNCYTTGSVKRLEPQSSLDIILVS